MASQHGNGQRSELLTAANLPYQRRIDYRSDDYSSLRHWLLSELGRTFPGWNGDLSSLEGERDLGVAVAELFAYLGDILGFYQDRRANEAYLGTAVLRQSLAELCALIDYRPTPGASASTLQAFLLKEGRTGSIPAGFKIKSAGGDGKPAFVFETTRNLVADARRNQLRLAGYDRSGRSLNTPGLAEDTDALLDSGYAGIKAGSFVILSEPSRGHFPLQLTAAVLEGEQIRIFWQSGALSAADLPIADLVAYGKPKHVMHLAERARADEVTAGQTAIAVTSPSLFESGKPVLIDSNGLLLSARVVSVSGQTVTLNRGFNLSLRRSGTRLYRATSVGLATATLRRGVTQFTRAAGATAHPEAGDQLLLSDRIGVERVMVAGRSGNTVYLADPLPRAMYPHATGMAGVASIQLYRVRLPGVGSTVGISDHSELAPPRLAATTTELKLDATYDGLEAGALLVLHDGDDTAVVEVESVEVDAESRTVLHLVAAVGTAFRIATLGVYGPFEETMRIDGYNRAEGSLPPNQTRITLQGAVQGLTPGDYLVVEGGGHAEGVRVAAISLDGAGNTVVDLKDELSHSYPLADTTVYGNVAPASHGETIIETVLGSGDQSKASQRFVLQRRPTTYVHDAEALRGLASTLDVFIGGNRWDEVESLADSEADDNHYMVEVDEDGRTVVIFGDGRNGRRVPTGRNNVSARYRVGLGAAGNVDANAITLVPQALDFLQSTRNPLAAAGGADAESSEEIRRLAPITVRTLDRAVSLSDYADLALAYAGIAKARADWDWEDGRRVVVLTVASVGGKALTPELREALRGYVEARKAPHQRLLIRDYRPYPVRLAITVRVRPSFLRMDTQVRVQATLGSGVTEQGEPGYFEFNRRALGEDLYLSDVYARVEAVEGVDHAVATAFHAEGTLSAVLDRVAVPVDALATGGHAASAATGILTVHAVGGLT